MTENEKRYRKECQKRVYINLKTSDFLRWSAYAALKKIPVASMIRAAVEKEILELEDSFDTKITDLQRFQDSLKRGEV